MEIKSFSRDQSNYSITSQAWFREIDYIGNIELINLPMMAIFSSAKCPASLILKAHDYATEIRNGKIGIISGFHAPAEKEALAVLLKGKCPLIVVLGRRLENARIPLAWRLEMENGRMLVLSPFAEYQSYVTKEISLKRNDLAARIAGRVLIVHSSAGGSLQVQVEKWKLDRIEIKYLDKI